MVCILQAARPNASSSISVLLDQGAILVLHLQVQAALKNNTKVLSGRDLSGYASRCGALPDSDSVIPYGCGTALADVHYHCAFCVNAESEEVVDEDK